MLFYFSCAVLGFWRKIQNQWSLKFKISKMMLSHGALMVSLQVQKQNVIFNVYCKWYDKYIHRFGQNRWEEVKLTIAKIKVIIVKMKKQDSTWRVSNALDRQNILHVVFIPLTHYLVPILNQTSPNDAFPPSFHKIHFNLILHLHLGILSGF